MTEMLLKVVFFITAASILFTYGTSQASAPVNVQEQEACNKAINWTYLYQQFIDGQMESSKSFLVIRDANVFSPTNQRSTDSAPEMAATLQKRDEQALTIDLNDLLDRIWNLETNNIRELYPGLIHQFEYPLLHARIVTGIGMQASACVPGEKQDTVFISDLLMRRLWETSLADAVASKFTFDKELDSSEQLLNAIETLRAIPLTTADILHDSDANVKNARLFDLATKAYKIAEIANRNYIRAILFVLGHESAHAWFDHCQKPPQETRADDYGLLVSTTWAGEQFQYFILASQRKTTIRTYISQKKHQRANARRQLKKGSKALSEFEKLTLEENANLTDAQITKMAINTYPENDVLDFRHPFGQLGYEVFDSVYEKAGLVGDDDSHPSLADREARLQRGYIAETLDGEKILLRLYKNRGKLKLVTDSIQERAGDNFAASIFKIDEVERIKHPQCEISPGRRLAGLPDTP